MNKVSPRRRLLIAVLLSCCGLSPLLHAQRGLPPAPPAANEVSPVADLLGGLESRLAANPDDRDGWVLLAKSYHYLARYEEAKLAFMRARELGYEGETPTAGGQSPAARAAPKGGSMIHDYIGSAYGNSGSDN